MISVTQVGRCPLCNPLIKEREECLFDAMIFFSGYTVKKFCRLVGNFADQTFAARGRVGLSVIPQDVVIASRPRNKNHSSLRMFHSFLIMRHLFFTIH